jgi:NAD+ kinase
MAKQLPEVLVVANTNKLEVIYQLEKLEPWLRSKAKIEVASIKDIHHIDWERLSQSVSVCIVIGGDGTILGAGRAMAQKGYDIPILGVNAGKLGFLAEFTSDEMKKYFSDALNGKLLVADRMILSIRLDAPLNDKVISRMISPAMNDLTIVAGAPFRMIELSVSQEALRHDGSFNHINNFLGDGLIIATPNGSTAYNMSAGGPIIHPSLQSFIISPIASHSLSIRPLVVSSEQELTITAEAVNDGTVAIVDGQVRYIFNKGETLVVKESPTDVRLVQNPEKNFYGILNEKLNWGNPQN